MAEVNLPEGWISSTIDEVVLNTNGARKPISLSLRAEIQGPYPYYGATGQIDSLNNFTHEGEHILIGEDGANLLSKSKDLAFIVNGQFWVNNHAHAVKCLADVPAKYIASYINSLDLTPYVTGSAQPKLTKGNLDQIPVPLPPLAEQKVIAEKLDTLLAQVDNTKARLERIPDILKRFRQSVLTAAVSGKLTEEWRVLNDLPVFKSADLDDLISSATNGLAKRSGNEGIETTVLRLADFKDALRVYGKERKIQLTEKELAKYSLVSGDLLVIRVNGSIDLAGKFIEYTPYSDKEGFCDHFIRLQVDRKRLIPKYLTFVANEGDGRTYLQNSLSTSAGQNTINQGSIRALKVPLPSLAEQTEIVRRVEELFSFADRIEHAAQAALSRVNNLTQSILAKAFRGELTAEWRAANPGLISGENSAEALLARIKTERTKLSQTKKGRSK